MKFFKLMMIALLAILGLNSCSNDSTPPLDFIEVDHSKDLVGTWTCLQADYAEALVISADGSAVSTGLADGEYWENVAGKVVVEGDKVHMKFEDDDNFSGHFDIIPGFALSLYTDKGERYTYSYCENDLADEVVGMWVSNDGLMDDVADVDDMTIQIFTKDGKSYFTGAFVLEDSDPLLNLETTYKVFGDLMIQEMPFNAGSDIKGPDMYKVNRINYVPNGTDLGDIMTQKMYLDVEGSKKETTSTYIRVNQELELAEKSYDYSNVYVTNVKGLDEDFEFAGQTLNYSTFDGSVMNKIMKNILLNFSFPTEEKFVYTCYVNDKKTSIEAPIVVDGNKVTIKMSENKDVYRDIDVYTFQDADATQLHMYMPRSSFVKFFANIAVATMAKEGTLDLDAEDEVKAVYDKMEEAFETINVSFVFKARK